MTVSDVFARHKRIAFQFSGGRDSLAALFTLEQFWRRMTVYRLNTGDSYPELDAVVDCVRDCLPMPMVEIMSDAARVRTECGLPTDLLPADNTGMGRALTGRGLALQGKFECCSRVIMTPMHQAMIADKITCIVRGTRAADFAVRHEFMSGHVSDGIELFYPIEQWTDSDVDRYIRARGLPISRFYEEGMRGSANCMGCTAWWETGQYAYLRKFHPARYEEVRRNIILIRAEVDRQFAQLPGDQS